MDTSGLMDKVHGAIQQSYPDMIESVNRIRDSGLKTALLTNNWYSDEAEMSGNQTVIDTTLAPLFDVVCVVILLCDYVICIVHGFHCHNNKSRCCITLPTLNEKN